MPGKTRLIVLGTVQNAAQAKSDYYFGYHFRRNEYETAAAIGNSIPMPILDEHRGIALGKALEWHVDPHGSLKSVIEIDSDTPEGAAIIEKVKRRDYTGFSFGQKSTKESAPYYTAIKGIEMKELSVVVEPGITGSKIHQWVEVDNETNEIVQSEFVAASARVYAADGASSQPNASVETMSAPPTTAPSTGAPAPTETPAATTGAPAGTGAPPAASQEKSELETLRAELAESKRLAAEAASASSMTPEEIAELRTLKDRVAAKGKTTDGILAELQAEDDRKKSAAKAANEKIIKEFKDSYKVLVTSLKTPSAIATMDRLTARIERDPSALQANDFEAMELITASAQEGQMGIREAEARLVEENKVKMTLVVAQKEREAAEKLAIAKASWGIQGTSTLSVGASAGLSQQQPAAPRAPVFSSVAAAQMRGGNAPTQQQAPQADASSWSSMRAAQQRLGTTTTSTHSTVASAGATTTSTESVGASMSGVVSTIGQNLGGGFTGAHMSPTNHPEYEAKIATTLERTAPYLADFIRSGETVVNVNTLVSKGLMDRVRQYKSSDGSITSTTSHVDKRGRF